MTQLLIKLQIIDRPLGFFFLYNFCMAGLSGFTGSLWYSLRNKINFMWKENAVNKFKLNCITQTFTHWEASNSCEHEQPEDLSCGTEGGKTLRGGFLHPNSLCWGIWKVIMVLTLSYLASIYLLGFSESEHQWECYRSQTQRKRCLVRVNLPHSERPQNTRGRG